MSQDKSLPLFNWQPPVKIIPFPANKQIGKARHVASVFMRKDTTRAQNSYWNQTESSFRKKLLEIGLPENEVDRQLEAFAALVQREVDIICAREGVRK